MGPISLRQLPRIPTIVIVGIWVYAGYRVLKSGWFQESWSAAWGYMRKVHL